MKSIQGFIFSVAAFLLLITSAQAQQDTMSLLFIGDIMGHDAQIEAARNKKTGLYEYDSVFHYVRPIIEQSDFAIGNLEVTLAGGPYKGYPRFSSPDALAVACKNAGMDILTTGNNHSVDHGKKGLERTIDILDSLNIYHLGTYKDQQHRDTANFLILEKGAIRIALLNYTYGTNYIEPEKPNIVNYIDRDTIKKDLAKIQNYDVDQVIVFIHWGKEYKTQPEKETRALARWMFNSGVDVIIGGHPHYVQPMQWDREKEQMIAYSLGNYVSNQRARRKDGGVMVELKFTEQDSKTTLVDASYILTWVYKYTSAGNTHFNILPAAVFEQEASFFKHPSDHEKLKLFINDSRSLFDTHNLNVTEKKIVNSKNKVQQQSESCP